MQTKMTLGIFFPDLHGDMSEQEIALLDSQRNSIDVLLPDIRSIHPSGIKLSFKAPGLYLIETLEIVDTIHGTSVFSLDNADDYVIFPDAVLNPCFENCLCIANICDQTEYELPIPVPKIIRDRPFSLKITMSVVNKNDTQYDHFVSIHTGYSCLESDNSSQMSRDVSSFFASLSSSKTGSRKYSSKKFFYGEVLNTDKLKQCPLAIQTKNKRQRLCFARIVTCMSRKVLWSSSEEVLRADDVDYPTAIETAVHADFVDEQCYLEAHGVVLDVDPEKNARVSDVVQSVRKSYKMLLKRLARTSFKGRNFSERDAEYQELSKSVSKEELIEATTFFDESILVFPDEVVSRALYGFGFFELSITSFLVDYMQEGDVFFDVGAHVGFFSMLAAQLVGESGLVTAFEPTPSTFEVLQNNIQSYPNAKAVNSVVWSESGTVEFHDFGIMYSAYNTAVSHRLTEEQYESTTESVIQVSAVSLDDYCFGNDVFPGFVKIDAENSELSVLKGMKQVIAAKRPVIVVEVGDINVETANNEATSRELIEYLIDFDYIPLEMVFGRYIFHNLAVRYNYDNILMVPKELLPKNSEQKTLCINNGVFS